MAVRAHRHNEGDEKARTLRLRAETGEEAQRWVEAIQSAIRSARKPSRWLMLQQVTLGLGTIGLREARTETFERISSDNDADKRGGGSDGGDAK